MVKSTPDNLEYSSMIGKLLRADVLLRDNFLFQIPEGAALRVNFYNIAKNPKVYTEPNTFNIDRFLSDGKLVAPEHPARAS